MGEVLNIVLPSTSPLPPNGSTTSFVVEVPAKTTETMSNDDAAWALTCAFLVLTMQTGFAMLECGCVSSKNVANIMVKNVVDVSIGGLSYWLFGYGLSFGRPSNAFCGMGDFFFNVNEQGQMGSQYSKYFFQFSFASTATTIVSGAVAERMKLHSYMIFAFTNTLVYCFPASWAWNAGDKAWDPEAGFYGNTGGFLYRLGFFDFAGVCVVHLSGGSSALVAATMLGPRMSRFKDNTGKGYPMSSPVTALTGMFMLWWAWLGFNCGSTFGVSGDLWKVTALVAVTTLNGAIAGGLVGLFLSMSLNKGKVLIDFIINSVLAGLVSVTGVAAVTTPLEALVVGSIGGLIGASGGSLMELLKIDDPVGAVPVHFMSAMWGTLAVGIFGRENGIGLLRGHNGVLHNGNGTFLGVQLLGLITISMWSALSTFLMFWLMDKLIGIRMNEHEELLGADWAEHDIHSETVANRLERTLMNLEEEHWNDFVNRLYKEVTTTKTHETFARHRMFSVDHGGIEDDNEEYADQSALRTIVAKAHEANQRSKVQQRRATLKSIKESMGMYSASKHRLQGTGKQNGTLPGQVKGHLPGTNSVSPVVIEEIDPNKIIRRTNLERKPSHIII